MKGYKGGRRGVPLLLFFLIIFWGSLARAEPLQLTFELLDGLISSPHLQEYSGKEVEIRGFFYLTERGEPLLANQPDLKSCCIGSAKNLSKQLLLTGKLPEIPTMRAVTLAGNFTREPKYGREGELIGLYYLSGVELREGSFSEMGGSALLAALLLLLAPTSFILYRKRRKC